MKQPSVSILLTSYNREDYIQALLDSLSAQTFTDWELVACDDASTDRTVEILYLYSKDKKNVKVLAHKNNLGQAKNFERGLTQCKGRYVAICDSDDVWLPTKLEEQVAFMKSHPDTWLCYHDLTVTDANLSITDNSMRAKLIREAPAIKHTGAVDNDLQKLLRGNHITGPSILFKRELIPEITPMPPLLSKDYWIALVAVASHKHVAYLDKALVLYRNHSSNVSGAAVTDRGKLIDQLTSYEFGQTYVRKTKAFIKALQRLNTAREVNNHSRYLLGEKIDHLAESIKILDSKLLVFGPLWHLLKAIVRCVRSSQKYHITHACYFTVYRFIPKLSTDLKHS